MEKKHHEWLKFEINAISNISSSYRSSLLSDLLLLFSSATILGDAAPSAGETSGGLPKRHSAAVLLLILDSCKEYQRDVTTATSKDRLRHREERDENEISVDSGRDSFVLPEGMRLYV